MPNAKWDGWRLECPIVVGYSSYSCQFCGDIQPHSWKTGSVTKFAFFFAFVCSVLQVTTCKIGGILVCGWCLTKTAVALTSDARLECGSVHFVVLTPYITTSPNPM